jgi:hypothetical protein
VTVLASLRLYAHALTLAAWALATWTLALKPDVLLTGFIFATVALAALVAERERGRRRRERKGT